MDVHLLQAGRDVDLGQALPLHAADLKQDLELETLLDAMGGGDRYLRELAERILLTSLDEPQEILYRQAILTDCLAQPDLARGLYRLAVEGVEVRRQRRFFWFRDSPTARLSKSLGMLEALFAVLRRVRALAEEHEHSVRSEGLTRLFATLSRELDDAYLATVDDHLRELGFKRGALISAELGQGNRSTSFVLRRPGDGGILDRLTPSWSRGMSFTVPSRDEHGLQALAELRNRGIVHVACALGEATDHVVSFFELLRAELGFYVAALNLHDRLAARGEPTCLPEPAEALSAVLSASGLYDAALAFYVDGRVVGNDLDAHGKRLLLVTGANQGGKSTFLRSLGQAQILMQAGMFVPAESFRASVVRGVFTHFKREEDPTMTSGKLDEELRRMSEIADVAARGALVLCNESFASTNEAEGSEIARQVVRASIEAGVRVVFVTHLYDFAHRLHEQQLETELSLRAERRPDGSRTFRIGPGEPEPTSHGADSYRRVFGAPVPVRGA
jgi:MutS domain V